MADDLKENMAGDRQLIGAALLGENSAFGAIVERYWNMVVALALSKVSDVWQALEAGSDIYLGDTFHSTARSAFVLKLDDVSTLELNQNSMLVLKLYNDETQFFLEHGECTASLESPHGPLGRQMVSGRFGARPQKNR